MSEFHFLRPLWLWALVLMVGLAFTLLRQKKAFTVWSKICDPHLLQPLMIYHGKTQRLPLVLTVFFALFWLILALAGPTWSKIAVPTYQPIKPHLILLDLSTEMLEKDITPDRLSRAKFKIHDLLSLSNAGQFGLMVYSSEPFVVSPLTDDAQTIDILLTSLTPNILPVDGNRLDQALIEAKTMFSDIGLHFGDILVLTSQVPSQRSVDAAQKLGEEGYTVSVMPILGDKSARSLFSPLAKAGHGAVLAMTDSNTDLEHWLALRNRALHRYQLNKQDDIAIWRDQGRWFLLPGMGLLLVLFRRGYFERIGA
jgi:Ca-activated chloride channel family protein